MSNTEKYIEEISKFTKSVDKKVVEKLAKKMASVMARKDASLVSVSDPKEMQTVRRNFIKNKLDVDNLEKANKAIEKVAETMKKAKRKNRVVFYYLLIEELKAKKKYLDS